MTEEQVFLAVLELPDQAARTAYLDEVCGGNSELRRSVEELLAAHERSGSFLDTPAAELLAVGPQILPGRTLDLDSEDGNAVADIKNNVPSPADPGADDLHFLSPSTRPDALGRLGHYEMLQVLGRGGFGIVFRAFDDALQRVVAIKVMAPQIAILSPARKRFVREAQSSARVRHENVVQVYEVGEQPLPYLAMEFIPGETLQQRLDRTGPLDAPEILRIGRQIAEGLAAAHACDLIHRDIKPGNILLEGGSLKVKITDFGLARAADDASISQSGIIAGTPMFMAPEQALGHRIDQRADLFSLGSVLYQMASGRPPFRAPSALAVLKRVAEESPRPIAEIIPETPAWLCGIITKLHAKNPADRFQSAREVADLLADCEAKLKAKQEVKNTLPAPAKPVGRKWVAAAAVLLLPVIALAVTEFAGVTHLIRRQTTSEPIKPSGDPMPLVVAKKEAPVAKQESLPPTYKNGIGMEFVIVPKGKSWLGGGKGKLGDKEVEIPADFYLGKYEVTQEEWEKVMGENPSHFSRSGGGSDAVKDISDADLKRFPIEHVSWDQCQVFVAKLNQLEKETGWIYRLPTEVEWEYACRGGPMADKANSAFHFYLTKPTDTPLPEQANFDHANGLKRTCKVGSYQPNVLGLFDMHGNTWEWCGDIGKTVDGDSKRVSRGGAFHLESGYVRATNRNELTPGVFYRDIGLRLARVPSAVPSQDAKTPATDPDRRAAEYVLSIGGAVRVNGEDPLIKMAADLPREAFRLSVVDVNYNEQVTDAGLAVFKECEHVTQLFLYGSQRFSDAGLAHFANCRNITQLHLQNTAVTDAGLARFKGSTIITDLYLTGPRVTDVGLAHFKDCKGLRYLYLSGTGATDVGLAHFKGCNSLVYLDLRRTNIGDAGLTQFKESKELAYVHLGGTQVTDAGLAQVKECKNLRRISLDATQVTDTGLADLVGLDQLIELNLAKTKVTAKGVEGLAKSLPKCKIEWDGGAIRAATDPFTDADVQRIAALPAAEQVEEVRKELMRRNPNFDGKVEHKIKGGVVTELKIPTEEVDDISPVRALQRLVSLNCTPTSLPGKRGKLSDISPLRGLPLTHLDLTSTRVTSIEVVRAMPLTHLHLDRVPITDLSPLTGKSLKFLHFGGTKVKSLSEVPVAGIEVLHCYLPQISDKRELQRLGVRFLDLWGVPTTVDPERLRELKPPLSRVNGKPLEEFLKDIKARPTAIAPRSPKPMPSMTITHCISAHKSTQLAFVS